jgi:uncharacterized protein (DUF488 family)
MPRIPSYDDDESPLLFTVGHSNRSLADFIALLMTHAVEAVVDVRRLPRSAANPQFNSETLAAALAAERIDYRLEPALAGLRPQRRAALSASPNGAWRNKSFQAYADHMRTREFQAGLARLWTTAEHLRTAVMCAELMPWRCHRSLIADAATARGAVVFDIVTEAKPRLHLLPDFARVTPDGVIYPSDQA